MLKPYLSLPRTIHVLCLGTFVNRAGTFLVPFLALYLTSSLGFGSIFATQAMGVYGLGGILAALTGGALADRIGRRTVMLMSLLGASSVLLVFGRLTSPVAILAAVLAFAFLGEMYRPAASAMIADLTTPAQRPTAFGLMYLTVNLGMVVSPVVGGFIAQRSFRWLFLGDAGTSALYAILLFFAVRETLPARGAAAGAAGGAAPAPHVPLGAVARRILGHSAFLLFCLATFLVSMAYMQSHTTLPLYLKGLGFGPRDYGFISAVNAGMIVAFQLPFTNFIRRWPREGLLVASGVITAIGFGLTGLAVTLWPLAATVAVWTVGEMIQSPYLAAVVADLAPKEMRGSYMGMLTLSFAGALMVGSPLGGWVLERFGARPLWGVSCGVALVGAGLYAIMAPAVRRVRTAPPPEAAT